MEGGGNRAMTRNTDLFVLHHKGLQPPVALLPSTSAPIGSTLVGKVSSNFHQHWCHGPMVGNTWGEGHLGNADPLESCQHGLVTVPFWEYWTGHHLIVAIKKTIYHSWLGDVTHGDISHDPCATTP